MAYIGVQPTDTYLSIASQQITGDGGATYTLNYSVSDEESVAVFVNNVRQNVSSYTVSGDQLTLGGTISVSDECWVLFLGRTVGTKTPAVGSVTNDMLAGSIATSKLADITANGITMADQWRLSTGFTGNATPISSNLIRIQFDGFGQIGTGMTESSGIFTFPSTGIYLIRFTARFQLDGDSRYNEGFIQTTTNNSTYDNASGLTTVIPNIGTGSMEASSSCEFLFDVTNTSTHKARFTINLQNTGTTVQGNGGLNLTHFTFIRLGDT
ncbi:hypothetical protein N9M26_01155 [Alphaproteobacteria bacterium]|nr:hypothetical protein [Alphaproteobacteria bacterium]